MRKLTYLLLLTSFGSFAQQAEMPLTHFFMYENAPKLADSSQKTTFTVKPLVTNIFTNQPKFKWDLFAALFERMPIRVQKTDFNLAIYPLFNIQANKNFTETKQLHYNTRGIKLEGSIGKQVWYATEFYENQAFLEPTEIAFTERFLVIPGQGAGKIFKTTGYDFSSAAGTVHYVPNKMLSFSMGHGKHLVGNGYRSLFLSDNAFNYPFFRTNATVGNWHYTAIFTQFREFKYKYYAYHVKKHASFGIITWKPNKIFDVSFLAASVWQTSGIDYVNKFRPEFFLPPIISPLFEYKNDKKTSKFGINASVVLLNNFGFYTQMLMHNVKPDFPVEYAIQAGAKCYDLFFGLLKKSHLYLQVEYNKIAENFDAGENKYMGFSHYNQPLGHSAGNNLDEFLAISELKFGRLSLNYKFNRILGYKAEKSALSGTSYSNIDFDYPIEKLANKTTVYHQLDAAVTINPAYRLQLAAGVFNVTRSAANAFSGTTIYVVLRTNLRNLYFDY